MNTTDRKQLTELAQVIIAMVQIPRPHVPRPDIPAGDLEAWSAWIDSVNQAKKDFDTLQRLRVIELAGSLKYLVKDGCDERTIQVVTKTLAGYAAEPLSYPAEQPAEVPA